MCAGEGGALFPVCSAGCPDRSYFLAAQPKPTAATEVAVTVTESKNAEDALRASETRYRRLFESAKDGILILDADTGKVVDANPFLISLLGYSHAEFLGKNVWD